MGNIYLLDCTLRDGGYINNWNFGEDTIKGIVTLLERSNVDIIELGFLRPGDYGKNQSLFSDISEVERVVEKKKRGTEYVVMVDMNNPVPLESIPENCGNKVDGIRVIFKKNCIEQGYEYCIGIKERGYKVSVNPVSTDSYGDKEYVELIERFSQLKPDAIAIVDTFGSMKRRDFLRYVELADHNMPQEIMLGYHAHNNLQQAFGNAEALINMHIKRDIIVDACVFGMGRGAGNLNLELFAEYLNVNVGAHYQIQPILEIMDNYLQNIYSSGFWGYSLPLYISASLNCHPN